MGTERCIHPKQPETLRLFLTCTSDQQSLLSLPDSLQLQAQDSTANTSPRCFQSPALCDAGTAASSPPAPLAQAAFLPHHQHSPCSVTQLPCCGTRSPPFPKRLEAHSERSRSKRRPAGDTRPISACQTPRPAQGRKSTVTTQQNKHTGSTRAPLLHTATHSPPEPRRVRKRGS